MNITLKTGSSTGGSRGSVVVDSLNLNMSSKGIINVLNPSLLQDAATKRYVDGGFLVQTSSGTPLILTQSSERNITVTGTAAQTIRLPLASTPNDNGRKNLYYKLFNFINNYIRFCW